MNLDLSTDAGNAYLTEAAAELRKARAANDRRRTDAPSPQEAAEIADRSMELAEGFTRLAAIKAGLPPCYHPARPEPGREPS